MASKIFKSILTVAMAILGLSTLIITGVLYQYFADLQQEQCKDELILAARATEQLGMDYLEDFNNGRYRLTWIQADGSVLFDSEIEASSMENHKEREEIKEALFYGTGSSVRKSATLMEQTIYEAVRLEDGSILRISVSHASALLLVIGMLQPICVVLVSAIALSAYLAHRMAKRIVEPLNQLDLDHPMENDVYEELSPLLHRIAAQHQEIKYQMRTLKRQKDEFDEITSNMNEALVLLDNNECVLSINPTAKKLFDVQKNCVGDDFLTIDRKTAMRIALKEVKEKGRAAFRSQIQGQEYQFDLTQIHSQGNYYGIVILAYDITEQVHAQRNRQEFTANVSHELKTPLQSIIGSAELMENGVVKEEDMPRFIERIRKEAESLVNLIDDIIRLSELDEEKEMPLEEVNLEELTYEVCETLKDAADKKKVTLEVEGKDVYLNGVPRLLYEIIYNLVDNAIKYNKPDGKVTITLTQNQNSVELKVTDTGIGIALEHQKKVFERFYRVDKSHSKASGGTGLGLSIVKHAVMVHHGNIILDSEVNQGTTITVHFDTSF